MFSWFSPNWTKWENTILLILFVYIHACGNTFKRNKVGNVLPQILKAKLTLWTRMMCCFILWLLHPLMSHIEKDGYQQSEAIEKFSTCEWHNMIRSKKYNFGNSVPFCADTMLYRLYLIHMISKVTVIKDLLSFVHSSDTYCVPTRWWSYKSKFPSSPCSYSTGGDENNLTIKYTECQVAINVLWIRISKDVESQGLEGHSFI